MISAVVGPLYCVVIYRYSNLFGLEVKYKRKIGKVK